ncbi:MAG: hypothetical protein KKH92_09075 [Firmicutes bacterium]|nr:hypothetical protein [Bacillota bacterium]
MKFKWSFSIHFSIFAILVVDILFSILSFLNYNVLLIFIYSIASSAIYLLLFSLSKSASVKDFKLYSITSWISIFLFTYITFGPYFGYIGYIAIPILLFAPISYIYFILRTRYYQKYQVLIINSVYLIIKVCLILLLILAVGLMGLGSV